MNRPVFALASLALVALASPALAASSALLPVAPDAAPAVLFDTQAPAETSGSSCKPKDEFGVSYWPWYGPGAYQGCVDLCNSYCTDNGGWLVEVHYDHRTPACGCTCCSA